MMAHPFERNPRTGQCLICEEAESLHLTSKSESAPDLQAVGIGLIDLASGQVRMVGEMVQAVNLCRNCSRVEVPRQGDICEACLLSLEKAGRAFFHCMHCGSEITGHPSKHTCPGKVESRFNTGKVDAEFSGSGSARRGLKRFFKRWAPTPLHLVFRLIGLAVNAAAIWILLKAWLS